MKILVCTDGSEHSQKALEKAAIIAEGCNVDETAIIHVYDEKLNLSALPWGEGYGPTQEDMEKFRELLEKNKNEGNKILQEAQQVFKEKNIQARTILKEGHPVDTIVKTSCDEGFDIIVIGSRGRSGLQKMFLGSVSSAVVQEAENCSVLTVK
ncbi:MAG: universal stress protein [Bacillota bacterium]